MPITFHCEHCGGEIRAADDAGGKKGKCPRCQNPVYVPLPADASGELPLAPLDPRDEQRAAAAAREQFELRNRLLRETNLPGEPGQRGAAATRRPPAEPAATPAAAGDPVKLVKDFLRAMAGGRLDQADACVVALAAQRPRALATIDALSADALLTKDFPGVPAMVLHGFLKQLRSRL
ncbi:MAG: hypothetical protein U1A27_14625 [Phycisphaerae bacterium]